MYFKTCFVPIFDRFVRFARVLQKNRKKSGNHTCLDNSILVLRILSHLKKYLFSGISSFIKVDQHEICRPKIYIATIFDDTNIFPYRCHRQKIRQFGFASFSENAQGARSGTHWSYNLKH